jgi:glucosylceramidase
MKVIQYVLSFFLVFIMMGCNEKQDKLEVEVYETSASGNKLTPLTEFEDSENASTIILNPSKKYQTITGFGGAFTEASAYLLNKMSKGKQSENN